MSQVHPTTSIVGESAILKQELATLHEFAQADAPVHIYGETGTGKELVARALHRYSLRVQKRFIVQNCAAVPDTLLHSLLFGHRRGAFTGADRDQIGVFEAANGGTLLLDEVGDMPPPLQRALLRVLQDGEVTRLGDTESRTVDVRLISASNKSLKREVADGRFRKDLYYRLVTLRVELPPLRARGQDIVLLAEHFLSVYCARTGKHLAGFEPDVLTALEKYDWPGNIRQLKGEVERACILTRPDGRVPLSALSSDLRGVGLDDGTTTDRFSLRMLATTGRTLPEILSDLERSLLVEAMTLGRGNKSKAAQILGVSRQRLCQRLQRWGLADDAKFREKLDAQAANPSDASLTRDPFA
jgi:transcriptional regulator with PAS, ATPase and Fis domain